MAFSGMPETRNSKTALIDQNLQSQLPADLLFFSIALSLRIALLKLGDAADEPQSSENSRVSQGHWPLGRIATKSLYHCR
jgi:hypothetical protein